MSTAQSVGGQRDDATLEAAVMKRVFWRLMPFLLMAYLICYIDRVNVGFASLQMNKAIGTMIWRYSIMAS